MSQSILPGCNKAESVAEDAGTNDAVGAEDVADANADAGSRTEADVEGEVDADVDEVEDAAIAVAVLGQSTRSGGVRSRRNRKQDEGNRKGKGNRTLGIVEDLILNLPFKIIIRVQYDIMPIIFNIISIFDRK